MGAKLAQIRGLCLSNEGLLFTGRDLLTGLLLTRVAVLCRINDIVTYRFGVRMIKSHSALNCMIQPSRIGLDR